MSQTNKKLLSRISGLFFRNPTIMCQLSIAPIIVIGVSLYNALLISLAMFLVKTPTLMCVSLIGHKLKKQYTTMIYLLISSLFYVPTSFLIKTFFSDGIETLGIYLPMIVINSIIIIRSKGFANKNKIHWVFLDSLVYVIVFFIETVPAFLLPFSGFILIGLLAAVMQIIYNNRSKYYKNKHKKGLN